MILRDQGSNCCLPGDKETIPASHGAPVKHALPVTKTLSKFMVLLSYY